MSKRTHFSVQTGVYHKNKTGRLELGDEQPNAIEIVHTFLTKKEAVKCYNQIINDQFDVLNDTTVEVRLYKNVSHYKGKEWVRTIVNLIKQEIK